MLVRGGPRAALRGVADPMVKPSPQLDLLLVPPAARARRTDPRESHDAAERIGAKVARLEALVLAALREHGPATTHELAERLGLSVVTVSPRMAPLERKPRFLVERTGEKRKGSAVWRVK